MATIDKLNERGLSNNVCELSSTMHECLPTKTKVTQYYLQKDYQTVITSRRDSVIKVSGLMHSDAFKGRLGFSSTVIISTLYYY